MYTCKILAKVVQVTVHNVEKYQYFEYYISLHDKFIFTRTNACQTSYPIKQVSQYMRIHSGSKPSLALAGPLFQLLFVTRFAKRGLPCTPLQHTDFTTTLQMHYQTIYACMYCGQQFTGLLLLRLFF